MSWDPRRYQSCPQCQERRRPCREHLAEAFHHRLYMQSAQFRDVSPVILAPIHGDREPSYVYSNVDPVRAMQRYVLPWPMPGESCPDSHSEMIQEAPDGCFGNDKWLIPYELKKYQTSWQRRRYYHRVLEGLPPEPYFGARRCGLENVCEHVPWAHVPGERETLVEWCPSAQGVTNPNACIFWVNHWGIHVGEGACKTHMCYMCAYRNCKISSWLDTLD